MKKGLLLLAGLFSAVCAQAQISFSIVSPSSIAGGYDFTSNGDGTNWGLPNLNDPNDAVLDTLKLVDDGTPGINAQGIPYANEGCNPLPPGSLNGKIAVVYRYDGVSTNVCWYGTKVLNAQNAGAIGVVMINREDALIDVPGTTDGPMTSIPFAFISKSDGEILRAKMDAGEDVVAFIGNKTGLYANDLGIKRETSISPLISATASQITQNASEFGFDVGTTVYNFGSGDQYNVEIIADVTGPGGNWADTTGPHTILSGDSIDIYPWATNTLNTFNLNSYPPGRYTLTYNISLGVQDESDFDNTLRYDFVISDSLIAYCSLDTTTNLPVSNANYRPAGSPVSFQTCLAFSDANASRLGAHGIYFSSVTGYNSGVSLEGEEFGLTLYEWNDVFTDLNDPNFGFNDINPVAYGFYYYPSDLQDSAVFGEFVNPVQLQDNQRYLACVETFNSDVYMGYDTRIDYTRSIDNTLEPIAPMNDGSGFYALGFGADLTPSIALKVFDASELGITEAEAEQVLIYPNPTSNFLTIRLNEASKSTIRVYNMLGKLIFTDSMSGLALRTIDVSNLAAGVYTVEIEGDQLIRSEFIKIADK